MAKKLNFNSNGKTKKYMRIDNTAVCSHLFYVYYYYYYYKRLQENRLILACHKQQHYAPSREQSSAFYINFYS